MTDRNLAITVSQNKQHSLEWMEANYYGQLVEVYQNYLCEVEPERDPNDPKKIDLTQTAIGMPDTWGWVQRQTARITAQIPNIRFRSQNRDEAELISRTLMYQWDRARMQRAQKKHVRQAALFGWSVKAWYWKSETFRRRKKVNLNRPDLRPEELAAVVHYNLPKLQQAEPGIQSVDQVMQMVLNPQMGQQLRNALVGILSDRSGLVPVEYDYTGYVGPASDVLFVGDCYPVPNFQNIQDSNWFIVERRRNREELERMANADPALTDGVAKLIEAHPNGTHYLSGGSRTRSDLRDRLMRAVGFTQTTETAALMGDTGLWTVTEMHTGGKDGQIVYVGDESMLIGQINYPYDLDGWKAFTELTLIDNLMCGWGDATARVLRGLQALHSKSASQRVDLVDSVTNPHIFTQDRNLFENSEPVKRKGRLRLVYNRGGANALQWEQNGPAAAAVVTALNDETSLMRAFQVGTGDSNMSMAANVDPNQNRTATGARLSAYNQDILTKDAVDNFNLSLADDAEMMFRLNRSEAGDTTTFEADTYNRTFVGEADPWRGQWVQIEPELFQRDGMITVEVGSTLADDDEAKMQKASALGQFEGNPFIDPLELTKRRLQPFVKPNEMQTLVRPPHPPPPPPPEDPKLSASVSIPLADQSPVVQQSILQKLNILPTSPAPGPDGPQGPPPDAQGMLPPGPASGPSGAPDQLPPPSDAHPGAMATAAAEGSAPPLLEGALQ